MTISDVGRWRRVQSRSWIEEPMRYLSDSERVVRLYCTTGPQSTSVGCFHLSPAVAVEHLGNVTMREFLRRLDRVVESSGWKWDAAAKVLWIPEWLKENEPQSPNVCKSWRRLLADVPDCELKLEAVVAIKVFLKAFAEGFQQAFGDLQVRLPATFPKSSRKTSRIQGVRSTDHGSRSGEHGAALRGVDTSPLSATNGKAASEELLPIARTVLKLTNPDSSIEHLTDAFLNYRHVDVPKTEIVKAINTALAERRVAAQA